MRRAAVRRGGLASLLAYQGLYLFLSAQAGRKLALMFAGYLLLAALQGGSYCAAAQRALTAQELYGLFFGGDALWQPNLMEVLKALYAALLMLWLYSSVVENARRNPYLIARAHPAGLILSLLAAAFVLAALFTSLPVTAHWVMGRLLGLTVPTPMGATWCVRLLTLASPLALYLLMDLLTGKGSAAYALVLLGLLLSLRFQAAARLLPFGYLFTYRLAFFGQGGKVTAAEFILACLLYYGLVTSLALAFARRRDLIAVKEDES